MALNISERRWTRPIVVRTVSSKDCIPSEIRLIPSCWRDWSLVVVNVPGSISMVISTVSWLLLLLVVVVVVVVEEESGGGGGGGR